MRRLIITLLKYLVKLLFSTRYKITVKGLDKINPQEKGIVFLPNHPSYMDAPLVLHALWPTFTPRPLALETYYYMPFFHAIMRFLEVLPVPNFFTSGNSIKKRKWEKVFASMIRDIKSGQNFLIYPSGKVKLTSIESLGATSVVYDLVQEVPAVRLVLVRIEGMWGSRFSKSSKQTAPDFSFEIFQAFKIWAKNLFFFVPKREITLTFEMAGEKFPRKGSKLEMNRYLESWYNNCVGKQKISGECLNQVSYSCLNEEFLPVFEPKQEEQVEMASIPKEIQKEVIHFLTQLSTKEASQIQATDDLAKDLGLDSLDAAEIIAFLQDNYEVKRVHPQQLTTVSVVMALAARQLEEEEDETESEEVEKVSLKKWHDISTRKLVRIPPGKTIAEAFLNSCHRMKGAAAFADTTTGVLTYQDVKLRALLLAAKFKDLPGKNVGVLLPASGAVYLVILALQIAGKVPVMINWTTGKTHIDHVVNSSELSVIISSWKFIDRLDGVDLAFLEEKLLLLEDLRAHISLKDKLVAKLNSFKSTRSLLREFDIEDTSTTETCVLLYTSGTESLPKGVPLSHHNILCNLKGALPLVHLTPDDAVLAFLPPFHSFGFTVTGLLPLICGARSVYFPDPTNGAMLSRMIEKFEPSIVAGAPTFLKTILKHATQEQLSSVRLFVTGAERSSPEVAKKVAGLERAELIEGYGITECAPMLTINEPGSGKAGVGRPIAGVELMIVHPETKTPLEREKEGLILARGPNVFGGYTDNQVKSPFIEALGKNWYNTGDLGALDQDGYLRLSGRLKRFVKVGGEMISLASLEEAINQAALKNDWPLAEDGPSLAVLAKESSDKKTLFFLFTLFSISSEQANQALKEAGLSNLTKFSSVFNLESIPVMGTGKVHYRQLEEVLENKLAEQEV